MRDKFCVKFGLCKKSAFIKFSKKQRKFSRQKNLQTSGQIQQKQAQIYRSYQKDSRLPA